MKKKVLVVDDEELILAIVEQYLSEEFAVTTCLSARQALQIVQTEGIDCIVSDFYMPELTGLELVSQLRSQGLPVPVILMSGSHVQQEEISAFTQYLKKPFEPEEIQEMVRKLTS